jgi:hypothetical protein
MPAAWAELLNCKSPYACWFVVSSVMLYRHQNVTYRDTAGASWLGGGTTMNLGSPNLSKN